MVVPHAGTWIEIYSIKLNIDPISVVPHAGTWIEIMVAILCGITAVVVPHAGTWIEIKLVRPMASLYSCRSPRGNVD